MWQPQPLTAAPEGQPPWQARACCREIPHRRARKRQPRADRPAATDRGACRRVRGKSGGGSAECAVKSKIAPGRNRPRDSRHRRGEEPHPAVCNPDRARTARAQPLHLRPSGDARRAQAFGPAFQWRAAGLWQSATLPRKTGCSRHPPAGLNGRRRGAGRRLSMLAERLALWCDRLRHPHLI